MNSLSSEINLILAAWNPIGVPGSLAISEYEGYVPLIIRSLKEGNTRSCLEGLLTDEMGLDYNSEDDRHALELDNIVDLMNYLHQKSI